MGALMINYLHNDESASNPKSKLAPLFKNAHQLFSYNSFHGGVW